MLGVSFNQKDGVMRWGFHGIGDEADFGHLLLSHLVIIVKDESLYARRLAQI